MPKKTETEDTPDPEEVQPGEPDPSAGEGGASDTTKTENPSSSGEKTRQPKPTSSPSPSLDLDQIVSAATKSTVNVLKDLGLIGGVSQQKSEKSEEKTSEKEKSGDGNTGDREPRRKHWLFGD